MCRLAGPISPQPLGRPAKKGGGLSSRRTQSSRTRIRGAPRFGGAILADGVTRSDAGRMDARGIINVFWAWGFPCFRGANAVFTLFNLRNRRHSLVVSFRKSQSRIGRSLSVVDIVDIEVGRSGGVIAIHVPLRLRLESEGDYEVLGQLRGTPAKHRVPFVVRLKPWPRFTSAEKEAVHNNPSLASQLRVTVECPKCKATYTFQESVAPDIALPHNVNPFPSSGVFECEQCGQDIPLRDVQGQIRDSLKSRIARSRAGAS